MAVDDVIRSLSALPPALRDALVDEYLETRRRFVLLDWGPTELQGGRFGEAAMRVLEWRTAGSFTAIGSQLARQSVVRAVENDATLPDGLRFHVRRAVELLLDVRNKRDVAHLGPDVDVNRMDAELVLRLCSWVMAEFVREFDQRTPELAQTLIDSLSVQHVPWIEEIDGDLLVLATELSATDRTLVALHHYHPESANAETLRSAVGYTNRSRFGNTILSSLAKERLVLVKGGEVFVTSKGLAAADHIITSLTA